MNPTPAPGRGRRLLVLLAVLFFAPLAAAMLLYFAFPDARPDGRVERGELIAPARPTSGILLQTPDSTALDHAPLEGKWTLVYFGGAQCDTICLERLYMSRQVRTSLNEKRPRVRRLYLTRDTESAAAARAELATLHPDLEFAADINGDLRRLLQPQDPQAFYLLDPLGNWLMRYPGDSTPQDLQKDLKHLLRLSQIG